MIASWINSPRHRVMVADFHGQIAAYTMVELFEPGEGQTMFRMTLSSRRQPTSRRFTLPQWRGSGLSGAIFEAAIDDARPHAFGTQMVLGTNAGNKRARKFYRRHGWQTIGRRTFMVAGIENEDVVMVRDL